MNVIKEIVEWANTLPKWQSDAVRRILVNDEIDVDSEAEILKLLKSEHGTVSTDTATPLTEADLAIPMEDRRAVTLQAMHNVENVNALAPQQIIRFGETGVTVIFGNNAAGKSGYSRVLKKACRARDTQESILPNIASGSTNPATAVFDFVIGDKLTTKKWVDGKLAIEPLARLMVFDTKCAQFYVDKANEVFFIPFGFHVFPELASLCNRLKKTLEAELAAIGEPPICLTQLAGPTKVGKLIAELTDETPVSVVENLATLSPEEELRLAKLADMVVNYRANDPRVSAENKRRLKRRTAKLRESLSACESALSDQNVNGLKNKYLALNAALEAARLASVEAFKNEPLPGVGSGPWKQLFLAARKYSESVAYPAKDFPTVDAGSVCVLCQQPLDESTRNRFERFKTFVQQEVSQNVEARRNAFDVAVTELEGLDIPSLARDKELLSEIQEVDAHLHACVVQCLPNLTARVQSMQNACNNSQWEQVSPLLSGPTEKLAAFERLLEADALKLDQMAKPAEQAKIEAELGELKARENLRKHKATLLKHISDLQLRRRLQSCVVALATQGITRYGSDLTKRAVTEAYEQALNNELENLGAGHLTLAVKKTGDLGTTLHRLEFRKATTKSAISGVLSEGEQRVAGLASFLAEVNTSTPVCGIILDDPVCSLDHEYRERVARRLVAEGSKRQVVIFTHDIVFLLALEAEAAKQQVPLLVQWVHRSGTAIGICDQDLPWPAMNVARRIGHLNKLLQNATALKNKGGQEAYEAIGSRIYGLLRETWERAVEERLLNDTVQRFRPSIETQRIKGIVIGDGDFLKIESAMTKCSTWLPGHDEPAAKNAPFPSPEELAKDVQELDSYLKDLKQRQDKAESARKAKAKPPQPAKIS